MTQLINNGSLAVLVTGLSYLAGQILIQNYWEIRELLSQQRSKVLPKKYKRPLISILISVSNDTDAAISTLSSVIKSSYRKYEIIIIGRGSSAEVKDTLLDFAEKYPKKNIRFIWQRKDNGHLEACKTAFRRKSAGDKILPLAAGTVLDSTALAAAARMADHRNDCLIIGNYGMRSEMSFSALLQRYELAAIQDGHGFHTLFTAGDFIMVRNGILFPREAFGRRNSDRAIAYEPRFKLHLQPQSLSELTKSRFKARLETLSQLFTVKAFSIQTVFKWTLVILQLLWPLANLYFVYLAVTAWVGELFLISWLGFSLYLALAVWRNRQENHIDKFILIGLVPTMYTVFLTFSLIPLLATIYWLLQQAAKLLAGIMEEYSASPDNKLATP